MLENTRADVANRDWRARQVRLENTTADVANRDERAGQVRERAAPASNAKRTGGVIALFGDSFNPEAVAAMTAAYQAILAELRLSDCEDAATLMVAKRVIEVAERGERDPQKLADGALRGIMSPFGA